MRKIALMMDGWKRSFTYAWPAGILARIRETDEEVNLYTFNSSGDWSRDREYNVGEYNIYRLPDLNEFDGIIVDLNNIRYPDVRDRLIASAKAAGKPVLAIANDIEGFYYVGVDNYTAMREVIAHLHRKHDCKRFWFVMGPKDNYENRRRMAALRDYMDEQRLAWREADFYSESFEYQCGINGFETLFERHGGLPDAVICANDNIAVGVCEAAAKHGCHAPRDFLVTGFDNFDKAGYYLPHITTVGHAREEVGYLCADILIRLWNGECVPHFNYTRHKCVFWESCGCSEDFAVNQALHAKEQVVSGIEAEEFRQQVMALEYEFLQCDTVRQMAHRLPKRISMGRCDAIYMIVDEHINDFKNMKEFYDRHLLGDAEFCVQGYPETMRVEFVYENGRVKECRGERISGIFPMVDTGESGRDYLFLPLHFRERTVGYFVVCNAVYLMKRQYLLHIINVLTSAMENLHKKERLIYRNRELSELSVKDAMTGMYNRLGYQELTCRLFDEKREQGENLTVLFIDMDRLKYINDHFGHIYGDRAIKTIAETILKIIPGGAMAVRTGGDEFLIILEKTGEEELAGMVDCIRERLCEQSAEMKLPFPLTVSVGYVHTDMDSDRPLDDYVREADEIMYREKTAKKAERT